MTSPPQRKAHLDSKLERPGLALGDFTPETFQTWPSTSEGTSASFCDVRLAIEGVANKFDRAIKGNEKDKAALQEQVNYLEEVTSALRYQFTCSQESKAALEDQVARLEHVKSALQDQVSRLEDSNHQMADEIEKLVAEIEDQVQWEEDQAKDEAHRLKEQNDALKLLAARSHSLSTSRRDDLKKARAERDKVIRLARESLNQSHNQRGRQWFEAANELSKVVGTGVEDGSVTDSEP